MPVLSLLRETCALTESANLLRSRDAIGPYMYLPPFPGLLDEEAVACLFRPALVFDELLAEPPRRVAQLQPEARRHLKVKLAAYWGPRRCCTTVRWSALRAGGCLRPGPAAETAPATRASGTITRQG